MKRTSESVNKALSSKNILFIEAIDHRHFIKKVIFILLLLVIPLAFIFTALFIGRYSVSVSEVFKSLASPFAGGAGISPQTLTVVLQLRLPRAIAAAFVGAGLSASGTAFQGVFRNPLVDSGFLGGNSGAGFGAGLAILLFGTSLATYGFAFAFGVLAVIFSYLIDRGRRSHCRRQKVLEHWFAHCHRH